MTIDETPERKLNCLLHDNRIFLFEIEKEPTADPQKKEKEESGSSSSTEQNVVLNILTTPKFRALSALYINFRLIDNLVLVLIIVLSIIHGTVTSPTPRDFALFSAIGLELFYDVMLTTNKYWVLQRLSFYIGIVLYAVYFGLVIWKMQNREYDESAYDSTTIISVLSIRLSAFVFEEAVDVAIDCSLHNELVHLQNARNVRRSTGTDEVAVKLRCC